MQAITNHTRGVFVIGVTPFDEQGAVDGESLDKVVDFYFEKGADGLTILGMMGEATKLTHRESLEVARRTIVRAQGKPIVVGVSSPGLAAMSELSKAVMDLGAAGVMVAPPSSLSTNEQIVSYFGQVVDTLGGDVPVVLQDFPLSTKVHISLATLNEIIEHHPSIVMLKHEDWPGLSKIEGLRQAEADGQRRISILCGNGGLFLTEEMERGADGAMTGFAFPEMMVQVVDLIGRGESDRGRDIFDAYLPLIRYEQQPGLGLAVRKYVLKRRGVIDSAAQRRPGAPLSVTATADVEHMLTRLENRLKELG